MSGRPVLAVIIGRAGSRGLPGKNALPLAGRPMVAHTIDAALSAASVTRTVVSTDCPAVAAAAREAGVETIERPAELATDEATVADAVRHAVAVAGAGEELIVILYANVPVRPAELIDRAVRVLLESGADSVQSYCEVGKHHPAWMVVIDAIGQVRPCAAGPPIDRRQDLPTLHLPDGGVIAVTRQSLMDPADDSPHGFFGRHRRGIVTERGAVVDVDDAVDLRFAEAMLGMSRPV